VCVLWDRGRSARRYRNPQPTPLKKKKKKSCPPLAHAHRIRAAEMYTQTCGHNRAAEQKQRGFPVFEGRLLVLALQLDHISPKSLVSVHTDRRKRGGFGLSLSDLKPPGLRGDTADRQRPVYSVQTQRQGPAPRTCLSEYRRIIFTIRLRKSGFSGSTKQVWQNHPRNTSKNLRLN